MKQTKLPRVHINEYISYFQIAREKNAELLKKYFDLKNINRIFSQVTISGEHFQVLKSFVENEVDRGFSFVSNEPAFFCLEQMKLTLKGYNGLINSNEFQLLSVKKRNDVITQQMITSKIVERNLNKVNK